MSGRRASLSQIGATGGEPQPPAPVVLQSPIANIQVTTYSASSGLVGGSYRPTQHRKHRHHPRYNTFHRLAVDRSVQSCPLSNDLLLVPYPPPMFKLSGP